jgi:hypothetical protein
VAETKFVTTEDGRRITYARWQYEQQIKQEAVIRQVNDLITDSATGIVRTAADLGQQEYGAFLRSVIPELLDQYGKVNATAAIDYYTQMREQWSELYGDAARRQIGRDAVRSAEQRYAAAITGAKINVAKNAEAFAATYAPTYDVASKTDAVMNFAMKVRSKYGHEASVEAMNNALTREVAMFHRDTVLFNSAIDPYVNRVQRVAQATACEFCRLMALGSREGKVRVSTYAAKFHDHCHCTIQPLFEGDEPVRPDYYDQFEKQYADASKGNTSAKDILTAWRNPEQ